MVTDLATRKVPLAQPWIGERERELVAQALDSGVLGLGPFAARFEEGVAAMAGRRFGVSCNSGTAGLHMAVRALGIGAGRRGHHDAVQLRRLRQLPPVRGRAGRVFVDIEEDIARPRPGPGRGAPRPRGREAVLPVHVFGRPCRIVEIAGDRASARGWRAHRGRLRGTRARASTGGRSGSFGDASVFAFYPNKQITTGEGGVVVTDDDGPRRRRCAACATRAATRTAPGCGTSGSATTTGSTSCRPPSGVAQLERLRGAARRPRPRRRGVRARRSAASTGCACRARRRASRSTGSCTSSGSTRRSTGTG